MRILKTVIWIICLTVLQTVFCGVFSVMGIMPELLLAFAVIFACGERDRFLNGAVLLVCAVIDASGTGRFFPAVLLGAVCAGLLSRASSGVMRHMPGFIKTFSITVVSAFAIGCAECFAATLGVSAKSVLENVLPHTVYTALCFCAMYPIARRTLFYARKETLVTE